MHIILGGTSGLGWEMACQLRARGERVLVLGKTHNDQAHGEGFALDLYDAAAVEWATSELERRLGEGENVQTFVWAAGYGWRGDFADQQDARSMVEVNFAGALPLVQWVWRRMLRQPIMANLVIISSTSGVKPRPDEAVYAATKHAQTGLARSLGLEATRLNEHVRVSLFLPGGMRTGFWRGREPEHYDHYNDPQKVAAKIITCIDGQTEHFIEVAIERGSLL